MKDKIKGKIDALRTAQETLARKAAELERALNNVHKEALKIEGAINTLEGLLNETEGK